MGGEHSCNRFRTKRLGDHCACAIGIVRGNTVRYPYDLEALTREPPVALDVGRDPPGMFVDLAIDLDDQPALQTNEIDDKRPDRVLAAEPQSPLLPTTQDCPQRLFGGR